MRLEQVEDTPWLLGKRSVTFKPRNTLPLSGAEPLFDDRDTRWWSVREGALHGSYSWAMQDYQEGRDEAPVPGDAYRDQMPDDVELPPVLSCKDFVKQVLVDQQQHHVGTRSTGSSGPPPPQTAVTCAFPDQPCPPGSYKVMSFVTPIEADREDHADANFVDYHFYVQHRDVHISLEPEEKLADIARWMQVPLDDIYDANPGLLGTPADRPVGRPRTLFLPNANVWSHKPSEWVTPRLHDGAGRVIHNPMRAVAAYSDEEGDMQELPSSYCCSFCVKKGQGRTGPAPIDEEEAEGQGQGR